ncbi:Hypothetical predicted protein [Podarcis lilfordi]|uniref:Uncharacterized protein n=1 Tax=Podarcis lilfordi TaxID=74358 RepID=A0AA35KVR4_9SAUR|nr:Hypothetical predicted protein [Podarcis lilfordi]
MKGSYGEDAPLYDVVKHWHRQFKCGRTSVETAPIPGQPQSPIDEDTIQQVEAAVLEDPCITVCLLAADVKISVGPVRSNDDRFPGKGITITGTYYTSLLQKLRKAIKIERHEVIFGRASFSQTITSRGF